jgi:hypothetical protein
VRCLQRIDRRGLSSACLEGMLSSSAPFLAVIDGDLQHDERLLPRMLEILKNEEIDIVVGSRYAPGGSIGGWDLRRARMSRIAVRLSRVLVPPNLSDPMSGFFMMRSDVLQVDGAQSLRDRLQDTCGPVCIVEPGIEVPGTAVPVPKPACRTEQTRLGHGVGLLDAAAGQIDRSHPTGAIRCLLHRRRARGRRALRGAVVDTARLA